MSIDVVSSIASFLGLAMGGTAFVRVLFLNKKDVSPTRLSKPKDAKLVKVLYIISDTRGRSHAECQDAVAKVQQFYVHLLRLGIYPVSVGANTPYNMRDYAVPELFEEAAKDMVRRADGVLLLVGHEVSPEACAVLAHAKSLGKDIFEQTEGHLSEKLRAWAIKDQ